MQSGTTELTEMHQTVQQLVKTLAQAEARHERTLARQRWTWLAVVTLLVLALYLGGQFGPAAIAQPGQPFQSPAGQMAPQDAVAQHRALTAQLPQEAQEELAAFEQRVEWISQYMQTWDERQAGAVVALMLHRIGQNMDAMPQIQQEMQSMNSLMQVMPVVAAEMQRMSANISVMTANVGVMSHNIDSTMGRMGRIMPW